MSRRPLVDQLTETPLAEPCDVPWEEMEGGERLRHCAACDREVWNLSAMTAREAEVRLLNAARTPCINYRVDERGRLVSRPEARAPSRRLGLGTAAFVATTLVAPGRGSWSGRVAAADDQQQPAPPGDTPPQKTRKKRPAKDDCPVAAPSPPGSAALTPPPPPLGGAPPPPRERPPSGTVQLKSATAKKVVIDGVTFTAPGEIQLPPGKHEAQISDGKTTSRRSFAVKLDGTFVLDLDRP